MLNKGDGSIMPRRPAPEPDVEDLFKDDDGTEITAEAYVGTQRWVPEGYSRGYANAQPPGSEWEELTEVDGRYLLRHDNKVYAAVEVPADSIIAQAFKQ